MHPCLQLMIKYAVYHFMPLHQGLAGESFRNHLNAATTHLICFTCNTMHTHIVAQLHLRGAAAPAEEGAAAAAAILGDEGAKAAAHVQAAVVATAASSSTFYSSNTKEVAMGCSRENSAGTASQTEMHAGCSRTATAADAPSMQHLLEMSLGIRSSTRVATVACMLV